MINSALREDRRHHFAMDDSPAVGWAEILRSSHREMAATAEMAATSTRTSRTPVFLSRRRARTQKSARCRGQAAIAGPIVRKLWTRYFSCGSSSIRSRQNCQCAVPTLVPVIELHTGPYWRRPGFQRPLCAIHTEMRRLSDAADSRESRYECMPSLPGLENPRPLRGIASPPQSAIEHRGPFPHGEPSCMRHAFPQHFAEVLGSSIESGIAYRAALEQACSSQPISPAYLRRHESVASASPMIDIRRGEHPSSATRRPLPQFSFFTEAEPEVPWRPHCLPQTPTFRSERSLRKGLGQPVFARRVFRDMGDCHLPTGSRR